MANAYNPLQTVAPTGSMGNDYINVQATPNEFGAQVGQALEQGGKQLQSVANERMSIETQRQGMLNETDIANNESKYNTQLGVLDGEFKSLKGEAAVAAHDDYVQKVLKLRQDISGSIQNDAVRRGFNVMAARTEGFTLRSYGDYKGTQSKVALNQANAARAKTDIARGSQLAVATDDHELGVILGGLSETAKENTEDDGFTVGSENGKPVYENYYNSYKNDLITNVIKTIADDPIHGDPVAAVNRLDDLNKQGIVPPATYNSLMQQLGPRYRSSQTRIGAGEIMAQEDMNYNTFIGDKKNTYITKPQYLGQHSDEIEQKARDWSQKHFPNDPIMEDEVASRTKAHISSAITQENQKESVNKDLVRRFVFGEDNGGKMISNIDQLDHGPKDVQEAWHQAQILDPQLRESLIKNILTSNAKGRQLTYGTDFWKHLESSLKGDVTDVTKLFSYVGPNKTFPLTNTGLGVLSDIVNNGRTPQGLAVNHSIQQHLEKMHDNIVGGMNVHNAEGEAIFNRAVSQILPKIQAGLSAGLTAGDLFDADSPDYVGGASDYDRRTSAQKLTNQATVKSQDSLTMDRLLHNSPVKKFTFDSLDKEEDSKAALAVMNKAILDKTITRQQAMEYAEKRGWKAKKLPEVAPR